MVSDWMAREPGQAGPLAEDGWLWHQIGDLPRAQARLQQAIEIDPHDKRALTEMAQVYEAMNRQDRALVLYERILERHPNDTAASDRVDYLLTSGVRRPQPD
jgi:tetratricopeptide (TPR) repeat protein